MENSQCECSEFLCFFMFFYLLELNLLGSAWVAYFVLKHSNRYSQEYIIPIQSGTIYLYAIYNVGVQKPTQLICQFSQKPTQHFCRHSRWVSRRAGQRRLSPELTRFPWSVASQTLGGMCHIWTPPKRPWSKFCGNAESSAPSERAGTEMLSSIRSGCGGQLDKRICTRRRRSFVSVITQGGGCATPTCTTTIGTRKDSLEHKRVASAHNQAAAFLISWWLWWEGGGE